MTSHPIHSPVLSGLQIELIVLPYLVKLGPPAFRRFLVDLLPHKAVQKWKSMIDVIDHTSTDVLAKKRAALAQGDEAVLKQVGGGKDIMSILRTWCSLSALFCFYL